MARTKKRATREVKKNIRKGGVFFSPEINVEIDVEPDGAIGEKITKVVNLTDGQVLGQVASGKNAIIKQTTQTIDDDFKIAFEVELTEEETAFVNSTTARAIIFLCRDSLNVPTVLTPNRKQTSYMYYITTAGVDGFLAVYTNNSGTDALARVFENGATQKIDAQLSGNKISITAENISQETSGNRLGYLKLPDGYSWDVKVIAF